MAYSELIKNFEKIRAYMRQFYVYGFKSRDQYDEKSARSYDDERRRIESWLDGYMRFNRTADGKKVFISIDSRSIPANPLFRAWKSKSFTDKDLTLHFILFDILFSPDAQFSLKEIMDEIYLRLSAFDEPLSFDDSTVRKKLKEYEGEGIIVTQKIGKKTLYSRAQSGQVNELFDALSFFSENGVCGVIGSFILDKLPQKTSPFTFKHHYITATLDAEMLALALKAMQEKRVITLTYRAKKRTEGGKLRVAPLKIYESAQDGRQYLIGYDFSTDAYRVMRLDKISGVKIEEQTPRFDELKAEFNEISKKCWGVTINRGRYKQNKTETVSFTVRVNRGEEYIIDRLNREKRCGTVTKIDDNTYRFFAEVYDASEMIPWIRTFICRITKIEFSTPTLKNQFFNDFNKTCAIYGVKGGDKV